MKTRLFALLTASAMILAVAPAASAQTAAAKATVKFDNPLGALQKLGVNSGKLRSMMAKFKKAMRLKGTAKKGALKRLRLRFGKFASTLAKNPRLRKSGLGGIISQFAKNLRNTRLPLDKIISPWKARLAKLFGKRGSKLGKFFGKRGGKLGKLFGKRGAKGGLFKNIRGKLRSMFGKFRSAMKGKSARGLFSKLTAKLRSGKLDAKGKWLGKIRQALSRVKNPTARKRLGGLLQRIKTMVEKAKAGVKVQVQTR